VFWSVKKWQSKGIIVQSCSPCLTCGLLRCHTPAMLRIPLFFRLALVAALFAVHLFNLSIGVAAPARIILDTDLAGDVDDAGALALLHTLADKGEAEILATVVSSKNEWAVPCLDAINTYYGRPDIPIGYQRDHVYGYRNTKDPGRNTPSKYVEQVARAFPHDLKKSSDAPDAVQVMRKALSAQPDGSVTVVSIGFLTNLRSLLDSRPDEHSTLNGEQLVARKVKEWVCMGGKFPDGKFAHGNGEYNVMWDTVASVRAINDWPTQVIFSGFEIGARVMSGARLRETPETNPVRTCYQHYNGLANRESWDQTAILYAVRGAGDYWALSEPGFCLMHHQVTHGYNEWLPTANKQHRYLLEKMPPQELGKVIDELMIQPPAASRN
jgi:inosine-uridine nucleoside N-ribohydrolase